MNQYSDGELIQRYQAEPDQDVVRELLNRYHEVMLRRLSAVLPKADAEDFSQIFWTRFFSSAIKNVRFTDEKSFERYLSSAVTKLKKEYLRNIGIRGRILKLAGDLFSRAARAEFSEDDIYASAGVTEPAAEHEYIAQQMIRYLVNDLIPSLPPNQRLIWLLRHEAEFCEPDRPLNWETLAQLNGVTPQEAKRLFEQVRDTLLLSYHSGSDDNIDPEAFCVYMLWTHSQRPCREDNPSMEYYSTLLNVPLNTLKTRYRKAKARLDEALNNFLDGGDIR